MCSTSADGQLIVWKIQSALNSAAMSSPPSTAYSIDLVPARIFQTEFPIVSLLIRQPSELWCGTLRSVHIVDLKVCNSDFGFVFVVFET